MAKGFIPVKSTKVFGGKEFKLAGHHPMLYELIADSKKWRKDGYNVRLVKRMSSSARKTPDDRYSRSGILWCMYVRKR